MSDWLVHDQDRARLEAFLDDYRKSSYAVGDGEEPLSIGLSPIDEEMVDDHESILGMGLPPLFRAYLRAIAPSWAICHNCDERFAEVIGTSA